MTKYPNLTLEFEKKLSECVKKSKMAIAASGTVTLELALMGLPTIVVYKTGFINAFIARHILKIAFVSLPNLALGREVFPELLQERCTVEEIEKYLKKIEDNKEKIQEDIKEVREKLSGRSVIENYTNFLVKGER